MANTYSQLYVHFIFGVRGKGVLIPAEHKEEIHKYICGIVKNRKSHVYAINSMPDHMHILVSLKPDIAPSVLMRDVKAISSKFINEHKWTPKEFQWQTGFAAISHAHSQLDTVIRYIENQEEHHRKKTWKEEYIEILEKCGIPFDLKYLFDDDDEV
jgi:putative transposase